MKFWFCFFYWVNEFHVNCGDFWCNGKVQGILKTFHIYTCIMLIADSHAICFQAVLRRRDAIQMEYESTIDELNKKKDEREHVNLLFFYDKCYFLKFFIQFHKCCSHHVEQFLPVFQR